MDYSDFVGAAQPEEIRKALAANAEQIASAGRAHGSGDLSSMRYASYKGHQITYVPSQSESAQLAMHRLNDPMRLAAVDRVQELLPRLRG